MMKTKNNKWIKFLMLASQILLTGFIIFWLSNQYNNEKSKLGESLIKLYMDSQSRVFDSILVKNVINPALGDDSLSTTKDNQVIVRGDTFAHMDILELDGDIGPTGAGKAIVQVSLDDSTLDMSDSLRFKGKYASEMGDMLVRSVRLFIHQSSDSLSRFGNGGIITPENCDTALFKKLFLEGINKISNDIEIEWDVACDFDILHHENQSGELCIAASEFFPSIALNNYRWYLLKEISPQILFALLLIIITGISFYLAHKSIRQQMMMNTLRKDFMSNMTHELKTPVSTVKVALEALKNFDMKADSDVSEEYLEMAYLEMDRLDHLIGKALNHSILEDNGQVLKKERVKIAGLVEETIRALHPKIRKVNASIKVVQKAEDDLIEADPFYLQGAILNILDNSLKYCPAPATINITIEADNDELKIKLSDNGPGIPKEYLGRIYDKFFRVPKENTHNIKGHGLGLSFASMVMEQHAGKITVKNNRDKGCTFELRLPRS